MAACRRINGRFECDAVISRVTNTSPPIHGHRIDFISFFVSLSLVSFSFWGKRKQNIKRTKFVAKKKMGDELETNLFKLFIIIAFLVSSSTTTSAWSHERPMCLCHFMISLKPKKANSFLFPFCCGQIMANVWPKYDSKSLPERHFPSILLLILVSRPIEWCKQVIKFYLYARNCTRRTSFVRMRYILVNFLFDGRSARLLWGHFAVCFYLNRIHVHILSVMLILFAFFFVLFVGLWPVLSSEPHKHDQEMGRYRSRLLISCQMKIHFSEHVNIILINYRVNGLKWLPLDTQRDRENVTATSGSKVVRVCSLKSARKRWHRKSRWKIDIYAFSVGDDDQFTHIETSPSVLFSSSLGYLWDVRWISSPTVRLHGNRFPEHIVTLGKIEIIVWPFIFIFLVVETKIELRKKPSRAFSFGVYLVRR